MWEVRVFTGRGVDGRSAQVSRTVRGGKRQAQRVAASLESRPTAQAAGRTVVDVLAAWQEVDQWWSRARAAAGIDPRWRLRDLRHWSATVAISGGRDVRTVAGRLGHAHAAMTLRVYAHAVEAAGRTLGEQLGGMLDDRA